MTRTQQQETPQRQSDDLDQDGGASASRFSRRGFLKRFGVGASAGAAAVAIAPAAALVAPSIAHGAPAANFGRMFPDLPSFQPPTDEVKRALRAVGARRGILDAQDDLRASPRDLIVLPELNVNNPNNDSHTAGATFMGQFMDHDMTFDTSSALGVPTDPARTPNGRNPTFDLDSVYGDGPTRTSHLYSSRDRAKLRIETVAPGSDIEDLPRAANGRAIISDPRNDENIIIAGLQAAVIKFHNNMVDKIRANRRGGGDDNNEVFEEARNETRWHYQYLILNEFLPLFVGQSMVDNILRNGRRFYRPGRDAAYMPIEFQGAAFRFGHSMVRPSYRANFTGQPAGKPFAPEFFAFIFDPREGQETGDRDDLLGGARAPRRFVGWTTFFRFPGFEGDARPNKRIDCHISSALFELPLFTIASGEPPTSLPQRNLLRHLTWSIPSGQAIAEAMNIQPLDRSELDDIGRVGRANGVGNLDRSTPLWFYIFREAEHRAGSMTLGPVGGRIVGEVIIGLLQTDSSSFLNQRGWRPNVPIAGQRFAMTDFLTFAGVGGRR